MEELKNRMDKTISVFQEDLSTLRAGRANPALLNKISVEYYGAATPLSQIANISSPEPRTLIVQPWDASILGEVEKAILKSDLGLNPNNDGKILRINFPPLTAERRQELVKSASKKAEDAKVAVRSIRRDGVDKAKAKKKANEITEDELAREETKIQELTDKKIAEIDKILAEKEKEITEV